MAKKVVATKSEVDGDKQVNSITARIVRQLQVIVAKENLREAIEEEIAVAQADLDKLLSQADDKNSLYRILRPTTSRSAPAANERTRATKADNEGLRNSILTQLKKNGPLKKRDFEMGSVKSQTFMNQVAKLVEEGVVKKEGQRAGTTYRVGR